MFYWIEYRPTQAVKECHSIAKEFAQAEYKEIRDSYIYALEDTKGREAINKKIEDGYYEPEDYEPVYNDCLRDKGLK